MAEEQILIVQLRQLGDILLTTPVIRALKKARPDSRLTFLSHGMGQMVLDGNPWLDEHFSYGSDWSKRQELDLALRLRKRKYDYVLDFMNNPRSAFYTLFTGARDRLAFHSARKLAYTRTVAVPENEYIVRQKFALLDPMNVSPSPEDLGIDLPWFEVHTKPLLQFFAQYPSFKNARRRVVISPTHRRPVRQWATDGWVGLVRHLKKVEGTEVVVIWGPGEEGFVRDICNRCNDNLLIAPSTSFRELACFIANCDLWIGTSNGPSHVAVSTGIPTIQLHGPTSGVAWCPPNDLNIAVQSKTGRTEDISLAEVLESMKQLNPAIEARCQQRGDGMRVHWKNQIAGVNG